MVAFLVAMLADCGVATILSGVLWARDVGGGVWTKGVAESGMAEVVSDAESAAYRPVGYW